jgi:hypothetical protein
VNRVAILLLPIIGGVLLGGCSSQGEMSKADENEFKQSLATGKEKLDPDKLPPNVREKVRGIMQAQKPPAKK